MHFKQTLAAAAALMTAALTLDATAEIRAVQMDLARQMETVELIKAFADGAVKAGFNTLVLYLEGRVRTKTFALPEGESYSAEQMKDVVAYATAKGLDVVPVVSPFGHAEHFFQYGNRQFSEQRNGDFRFGKTGLVNVFCPSLPEGRAFIEKYLEDIMEIFPSKNFHMGLDEVFDCGLCEKCRPRVAKEGLGGYFNEVVKWAHSVAAKHGRRMWMWDDYYDFFPEALADLPKDILMCHWQYGDSREINRHGPRSHFGDRLRVDWLKYHEKLGLRTLMTTGYGLAGNNYAYNDYARKRESALDGAFLTFWEFGGMFWAKPFFTMTASGKLYCDRDGAYEKDVYREAAKELLPSLDETQLAAALKLLMTWCPGVPGSLDSGLNGNHPDSSEYGVEAALRVLKATKFHPGEGAVPPGQITEAAILDDLVTRAEYSLAANPMKTAAALVARVDRTARDVKMAKALAAKARPIIEKGLKRITEQQRVWRPGCFPLVADSGPKSALKFCDKILAMEEKEAADDEAILEVVLTLPDFYGIPRWTVEAKVGGKWQTVAAEQGWKPNGCDWAAFTQNVRIKLAGEPTALQVKYHGWGSAELDYISIEKKNKRWVPAAITGASGLVRDAQHILKDTYAPVRFGWDDATETMHRHELSQIESVLELSLREE